MKPMEKNSVSVSASVSFPLYLGFGGEGRVRGQEEKWVFLLCLSGKAA